MAQSFARQEGGSFIFAWASEYIGRKIVHGDRALGRVVDLVARREGAYPIVEGALVRDGGQTHYLPFWPLVHARPDGGAYAVDVEPGAPPSNGGHFRVREVLMDKQIVDTHGAKVERVNDVHLLATQGRAYIVHVDVGFTGLVRRMGWELWVRRVARTLGRELHDDMISWRYVQTLEEGAGPGPVRLRVPHKDMTDLHPGELAEILEELGREDRIAILHTVDTETAASALEALEPEVGASIIQDLDPHIAADIFEEMEPSAAADIALELPETHQDDIMQRMEPDERAELERLGRYEERTAGGLMGTDFLAIAGDATVADAIALIRQMADEVEIVHYVFLVDAENHLRGAVTMKRLVLADPAARLADVAETQRVVSVRPDEDLETVAETFYKYNFLALPVTDADDRLIGIIPFRHSFDELVEHYYKLAS
ncbi:CBS domain-containing protein [bacterium]|nr:CBS domain-containing protein [bacterium]